MVQIIDGSICALDRSSFEHHLNHLKNISTVQRDMVELMNIKETFPFTGMKTWRDLVENMPADAFTYLTNNIIPFVSSGKPTKILSLVVVNPGSALSVTVKVHTFRFQDSHKTLDWPTVLYDWSNTVVAYMQNPGHASIAAPPNSTVFKGMSVSGVPTDLVASVLHKDLFTVNDGAVRAKCLDSALNHFDECIHSYCLRP